MVPAQGFGHLQRGPVEIIHAAIAGEFQHRVGVELREGGQFPVFRLRADAFQGADAMVGQRLQGVEVILRVGIERVAPDGQDPDAFGPVADGHKHERGGGPQAVANRIIVRRRFQRFMAQDEQRPLVHDLTQAGAGRGVDIGRRSVRARAIDEVPGWRMELKICWSAEHRSRLQQSHPKRNGRPASTMISRGRLGRGGRN